MRSSEVCGEPSCSRDSVPRKITEWGVGQTGAKPPSHPFSALGGLRGAPPPPQAAQAMNGQLGFSRNCRHPSPDLGLPELLPSQGGELRDRGAN